MKFQYFTLLNVIATSIYLAKAQDNSQNTEDLVTLETYYDNELYPYLCTKSCKEVYDRYYDCFNTLDNQYTTADYPEVCEVYNSSKCQNFINDLYTQESVCINGNGPDDFNIYDEITMNKVYYIFTCSKDAKGQLCPYTELIQNNVFNATTVYHMREDVNNTVEESCSKSKCRENLRQGLEYLVPLYEYDVKVDSDLFYEAEFIDNDKNSLSVLKSEACISQDPIKDDESSAINNIEIISKSSILTIFIIALLLL